MRRFVPYTMTAMALFRGICAAILLLLSAPVYAKDVPEGRVTLQLKWKHQFQFAGFYAAVEQRYYQDEKLHVTIKEGRPGIVSTEEVVAQRADYGVGSPALLLARNRGDPVVVLAAILQHSAEALITTAASGISSPHDLIGKRVLMRPRVDAEIMAMIKNEGIAYDRIQILEHTWNLDDLIDGRVDVYGGYITDVPFLLKKRGVPYDVITPLTYGVDFYGDCLFTTEAKIAADPDEVSAFRKASLLGWEYAMQHSEQMIDVILEKYDTTLSREALVYEAETMQNLMQPKFIGIGHVNPGRWKHIADTFVAVGMLTPDYSLDGFIYDPNRPTENRDVILLIKIVLAMVLFIAMVSIILVMFNIRLRRKVDERTAHLTAEVNERVKVEKELQGSLAEKEILLKEVHHRVKNNLQMVESLLNLQVLEAKDKQQADAIQDSKNRVHSMALVHEALYRSEEFSAIDIRSYIEQLVNPMLQCMKPSNAVIDICYDIEPIMMNLDTAIACGLIANELVSNALKHAFKLTDTGTISISLKRINDKRLMMQIRDDGLGISPDQDLERQGTLGMRIVRLMAEKQLEAQMHIAGNEGFSVNIEFPLEQGVADE